MTEHMMALGDYRFSVRTAAYAELTRAASFRWQAQQRLGAPPAQQYLGPGTEEISLRGTLYPRHKGGLEQVEAMRGEARRGRPLSLTGGDGSVWGRWCIVRMEETQRVFYADGRPRQVEFRLQLVRYGEDRPAPTGPRQRLAGLRSGEAGP